MAEEKDLSAVENTEVPTAESRVILPLIEAIKVLAPNCRWSLEGYDISGLRWEDDPSKRPNDEDIVSKAKEILAEIPMRRLRKERDARMREVDWVTLRAMRTGEPIPQEWQDYMQALADITETADPKLVEGVLIGVDWPVRPDGEPAGYFRGTRG